MTFVQKFGENRETLKLLQSRNFFHLGKANFGICFCKRNLSNVYRNSELWYIPYHYDMQKAWGWTDEVSTVGSIMIVFQEVLLAFERHL